MSDMTARDVTDALHRRYTKKSQGKPGERYVCIEEARSGAGFQGNNGQCDFLAINTWQSRGMELIGHEVKVSMSDWKAELDQPHKAERFAKFCRRWYVAVPSVLAAQIKHEVPPTWGLLSVSDAGRVTETVKPEPRDPADVPAWWWVGWLAQIDRQHKRRLPQMIREGMDGERERMRAEIERAVKGEYDRKAAAIDRINANLDAVRDATGIDLRWSQPYELVRLRQAWEFVKDAPDLRGLAHNMRSAADALDAVRNSSERGAA